MPPKSPSASNLTARTVTMPLAALTMATILFVYARMSIHAAKRNAASHREADGGQISWRNESLRRHGVLEPPERQGIGQLIGVGKAMGGGKGEGAQESQVTSSGISEAEEKLRRRADLRR